MGLNTRQRIVEETRKLSYMNDENEDTQPQIDLNHAAKYWLTVDRAAPLMKLTVTGVREACQRGLVRAVKLGPEWRIDPDSAANYQRTNRGKKAQ